jgi:hypothetical protein
MCCIETDYRKVDMSAAKYVGHSKPKTRTSLRSSGLRLLFRARRVPLQA